MNETAYRPMMLRYMRNLVFHLSEAEALLLNTGRLSDKTDQLRRICQDHAEIVDLLMITYFGESTEFLLWYEILNWLDTEIEEAR